MAQFRSPLGVPLGQDRQDFDENGDSSRCIGIRQAPHHMLYVRTQVSVHSQSVSRATHQRHQAAKFRQSGGRSPIRRELKNRGRTRPGCAALAAHPRMRHLGAQQHQVAVAEGLHMAAHPAQSVTPLDPGQLGVAVAVKAAPKG